MVVDLPEELVNALDDLGQVLLPLGIPGEAAAPLLEVLDDLLVLLLLLHALLEGRLHVLVLVDLLEGLDVDDRLVGEPDLLAPVRKVQSRVGLRHVLVRYLEGADHRYLAPPGQGVLEDPGQLRGAVGDELLGVVFGKGRDDVSEGGERGVDELGLVQPHVDRVGFLDPLGASQVDEREGGGHVLGA